VSWAVGGPYVGWCPLGFRNQPIIVYERNHRGGHAVPRAGQGAWVYARNGDMTAKDLARRRVQADTTDLAQVRIVGSPRARLTKDLRVTDAPLAAGSGAGAVRTVRTKPTPGDTVPELRHDNQSLLPPPTTARRRREGDDHYDRGRSFGEAGGHTGAARPAASEPASAAPASAPPEAPPAAVGGGDTGRARWQRPEAEAARPRGESAGSDDGAPREAAPRREYAAPRRERSGGTDRESAPASAPRESGGSARPREQAPHDGGSKAAPAAKERTSSGGARHH
jgi:hypothetical protein